MAVYEFECRSCGERFEVNVPMTEHDKLKASPPACPKCGKKRTQQLVSMFSCKAPTSW